jgi:HSP20 family molecular chaperone IbpA
MLLHKRHHGLREPFAEFGISSGTIRRDDKTSGDAVVVCELPGVKLANELDLNCGGCHNLVSGALDALSNNVSN